MRTTIRQVAERAQVSPVTVSNILRGVEGCASEITRERVMQVAHEMNYIPVQAPVSQNRANESRVVSVVFEHSDISHFFLESKTFDGLAHGAHMHGYDLLMMLRPNVGWQIERPDLRFLDRRSDGFIFATNMSGVWDEAVKTVAAHKIPTVVCYRRDIADGVAYVNMDNERLIESAVDYLLQRGHSRIAHLAGPPWNYDAGVRRATWQRATDEKGLDGSAHLVSDSYLEGWKINHAALESVFSLGVTGVVCFNDNLAAALYQMATERGLKIPDDLSIIGIDNRVESEKFNITTFGHSFTQVGQLAMDAWGNCANGKPIEECHQIVPFELIERDSVRIL